MVRFRSLARATTSRLHHGLRSRVFGGAHECPACGRRVSGFVFFSYRPCHCPLCGSTPRERFVIYAIEQGLLTLPPRARLLHVAPGERSLQARFRLTGRYVAGDLCPERYGPDTVRLDLQCLDPDEPFDVIYASHVLEHLADDRAALRSVFESLVPGGLAIFLVPLRGPHTIEGTGPDTPAARLAQFGKGDHRRQYGADIVERFARAGFAVRTIDAGDLPSSVIHRHGFETHGYRGDPETDRIFVCTRPRNEAS